MIVLAEREKSHVAIDESSFKELVQAEYGWLCDKLTLTRVPLEFEKGEGLPRYGGTPRKIVITYTDGDLGVVYAATPTTSHGPPSWNTMPGAGHEFWDEWRTTLWHEVCHQLQDNLGKWDPRDGHNGHGDGWKDAIVEFARRVSCANARELARLICSM